MNYISFPNIISVLLILLLLAVIYYLVNIGNRFVNENNKVVIKKEGLIRAALIIVAMLLVYTVFKKYPIVGSMIQTTIFAIVLAYIINPLVMYLEKKGINRVISILIVYTIIIGVLTVIIWAIAPKIVQEFRNLVVTLPGLINSLQTGILDQVTKISGKNKSLLLLVTNISESIQGIAAEYSQGMIRWLSSVADKFPGYFGSAIRIILVPIFSFYILIDKEKLIKSFKNLIPENQKKGFLQMASEINVSLSEFVRGRIVLAIFVGILTAIVLLLLKIEFAIVIGVVTMIADIIPYIGPFLGFLPAVIMAAIQSPIKALWVGLIFIFIQWIENNIIAPKILGESTGLKPYVILLSLIIGGDIAGVWGMIFSVPIVSTVKIIIKYMWPAVEEKYNQLFRPKQEEK